MCATVPQHAAAIWLDFAATCRHCMAGSLEGRVLHVEAVHAKEVGKACEALHDSSSPVHSKSRILLVEVLVRYTQVLRGQSFVWHTTLNLLDPWPWAARTSCARPNWPVPLILSALHCTHLVKLIQLSLLVLLMCVFWTPVTAVAERHLLLQLAGPPPATGRAPARSAERRHLHCCH